MEKSCNNCANAVEFGTQFSEACCSCVVGEENGRIVSAPSMWRERKEDTQNCQFSRVLTMKDISEINRVLGIIEGLTYAVQDSGIADGLVGAIERIEAVVNKEE